MERVNIYQPLDASDIRKISRNYSVSPGRREKAIYYDKVWLKNSKGMLLMFWSRNLRMKQKNPMTLLIYRIADFDI